MSMLTEEKRAVELVPPCERSASLYLLQRRQELLAPLRALTEVTTGLARQEKLAVCELAHGDIEVIRRSVREMFVRVRREFNPMRGTLEAAAKALNHDLRTPLAVVMQYGDDLCQSADEYHLTDFLPEFELIRTLGRRVLTLMDRSVVQLRSVTSAGLVEEIDPYLEHRHGYVSPAQGLVIEPSPRPGRILVVEDHNDIRAMICGYLTAMGHTVVSAIHGGEAESKLRNQVFDLLLTDIAMPILDGFELIAKVKSNERLRDLPIVVLSGHSELEPVVRCIALGADDYLPKPFNAVLLRARVESCLNKKRLHDQAKRERGRYKELLHSILPAPIVDELSRTDAVQPVNRDGVAVLFADIVGFTTYCDIHQNQPEVVLDNLRQLFEGWEQTCTGLKVQKIKTIGDAFMAAAGLTCESDNAVFDCARLGLEMIRQTRNLGLDRGGRLGFDLRVGVHIGPVVAGVLGRSQATYDLWGDTVNVASRLESHGRPGCVNLSDAAWSFVEHRFTGETRSTCCLKGKSEPTNLVHIDVDTYEIIQF